MAKKNDVEIFGYVKKETMYMAAAISLCIGFFTWFGLCFL
jgi:hypothetical protein